MKLKTLLIIFTLSIGNMAYCQNEGLAKIWLDSIHSNKYFKKINIDFLRSRDLKNEISNISRFEDDTHSFYSGVFGKNFARIDFLLTADKNDSLSLEYNLEGFNKLGNNIRPIKGYMRLIDLLVLEGGYGLGEAYLAVLDCKIYEPGDKDGDGFFSGIYTLVLYSSEDKFTSIHSASGDFSEYSCVFVGTWRKYNSTNQIRTIFSYDPIGLYDELPMCSEFYTYDDNPDNVRPKDKYLDNGWRDYENEFNVKWWE